MANPGIEYELYHLPGYTLVTVEELEGLEQRQIAYKMESRVWAILPRVVKPLVTSENFGAMLVQGAKEAADHAKAKRATNEVTRMGQRIQPDAYDGPEAA